MQDRRDAGGRVGANEDEPGVARVGPHGETVDVPASGEPAADGLRHPFRRFFARHPTLDLGYRIAIGVLGAAIVALGIVLLPLPGPGWLIIFAGLAVLATEFVWADRLLDYARDKVRGWTHWVGRQSVLVRALIGLGGLLLVAGAVWLYVATQGVPEWLPLIG